MTAPSWISGALAGALTVSLAAALPTLVPTPAAASLDDLELSTRAAPAKAHRLIVKLASPGAAARVASAASDADAANHRAKPLGGGWYLLRGVEDTAAARSALRSAPEVQHVQVDRVRRTFGDPFFRRYQPYLRASMDVDLAWSRSSGRGVTVAVVDTGVDPRHEDLPRLLRGRDFVSGDDDATDSQGHGTFVAGVIAAQRDNERGIAGVSRASILPVRVMNDRGVGLDSNISRGIRWAAGEGADIINLSLGSGQRSRILRDAVNYATRQGSLVVASSGNSGKAHPKYPAAYPQVVAVGATDLRDRMTSFTSHGPWLDLVAPGVNIASTVPGDGYAIGGGTSFSAPLVAGVAALVLGKHPRWSVEQLRSALLAGAADAGPVGPDPFTGMGVVDADGLVGGPAKRAVDVTGPTAGTLPVSAQQLRRDSVVPASNPEGTDRWFRLEIGKATRVIVTAGIRTAKAGVRRGDIELTLYDSALRRLDVADDRVGAGTESVRAVANDDVFVRVRNLKDTRWPSTVDLGLQRSLANPGNVQLGSGPRPTLIESTPLPESYGAPLSGAIGLLMGSAVATRSVNPGSVRLLDGETGERLPRSVVVSGSTLTVTPDAPLGPTRTYAVVLDGIRTTGGRVLAAARVGFRTLS